MGPLGFLSVGFAPGLLWLWLIVRRSRHRPEPRSLIVRTFLLGVAVALPIVFVEQIVHGQGGGSPSADARISPTDAAFLAFAVAGLCEELGKLWVVQATLGRSPYLDDPLRGLIFSSAVALGFSSIENVGYMVSHGAGVIVQRSVLCTMGHVAFSALWGFALGWGRQYPRHRRGALLAGVAAAIGVHGLYDYFLFVGEAGNGILVFIVGASCFVYLLSRARRVSQREHAAAVALLACRSCGLATPATAAFCPGCGNRLNTQVGRHCGNCRAALPGEAGFCPNCGAGVAATDAA